MPLRAKMNEGQARVISQYAHRTDDIVADVSNFFIALHIIRSPSLLKNSFRPEFASDNRDLPVTHAKSLLYIIPRMKKRPPVRVLSRSQPPPVKLFRDESLFSSTLLTPAQYCDCTLTSADCNSPITPRSSQIRAAPNL